MNLNEIIAATTMAPQTPAAPSAHSFARGEQITSHGLAMLNSTAHLAPTAYRGLGTDVASLNNDPQAILEAAGMNWKTVPMPILIQGKTENRLYPGMAALVRSDNGGPLAIATTSYKPHHNSQIMNTLSQFANVAGLNIARVGMFDNGTRGFAIATSQVSAEAKVGDVVAMRITMRWGHEPGFATRIQAWSEELRCSNGAVVKVESGRARFTHMLELTKDRIVQAKDYVMGAEKGFQAHVAQLRQLRAVPSNRTLDMRILAQLFQPELAERMDQQILKVSNLSPASSTPADENAVSNLPGASILDAMLARDDSRRIVDTLLYRDAGKLLKAVVAAYRTQPGAEMTQGTMAHAYSAVTHYNSNVRGRSAETGVEANLFGTANAGGSVEALELSMAVAGQVARMHRG
jgi:hypothetical protein